MRPWAQVCPTFLPLVCSYSVCPRRAISPELFIILILLLFIIIVIVITIFIKQIKFRSRQTGSAGHSFSLTTYISRVQHFLISGLVGKDEPDRPHLYEQVRRLSSNPLDLNSNKCIYSSFRLLYFHILEDAVRPVLILRYLNNNKKFKKKILPENSQWLCCSLQKVQSA